ncbi:MAG: aminodeoxychorismate/anthranilate synthase component II [Desulfobacteraceae bacterium]|nr:aminodeoxychorismate/anthranilate synthase component II [Desulfobacteraceae bacterium]
MEILSKGHVSKLLVIDNYDSFTYNLVQMFTGFDLEIVVVRADKISLEAAEALDPSYVLISPGPKDPVHAGISMDMIRAFCGRRPVLGVCLGMQCINEVFGGRTVRAPLPVHGKKDWISHEDRGIFKGMPSPFAAARYHSLIIDGINPDLAVTAWNGEGIAMGVELPGAGLFGVQFHPESFLTDQGHVLIENFIAAGQTGAKPGAGQVSALSHALS